jgi:alpha-tubulin suppressor-like RCC1 family protein
MARTVVVGGALFATLAVAACGESGSTEGSGARGGTGGDVTAGIGSSGANGGATASGGTGAGGASGSGGRGVSTGGRASVVGGVAGQDEGGAVGEAGAGGGGASGANADAGAGGGETRSDPSPDEFIDVAPGDQTTCAISAGHALYCWGYQDNTLPMVGDGRIYRRSRPVRIGTFDDWTEVESGARGSCALRNGELYCWGAVDPTPSSQAFAVPTRVGDDDDWESIGVGKVFGCGIRRGGSIWCWGTDEGFDYAVQGPPSLEPVEITTAGDIGENTDFEQLSVGRFGGCAIREGALYCWGTTLSSVGIPARFGDDADWESVSVGDRYACGIRSGGDLYCWGQEDSGEVGDAQVSTGGTPVNVFPPIQVGLGGGWSSVGAYTNTTCGVRDGALYCWGSGAVGVSINQAAPPTRIGSGSDWQLARTGDSMSCGIRSHQLYCWGSNDGGQVGAGVAGIHATPQLVSDGWQAITLGRDHACGIKMGEIWCFGDVPQRSPSDVPLLLPNDMDWRSLSAGYGYTCGLRADNAFCWGNNLLGRLGTGSDDSSPSPWGVGPKGNWTSISATNNRTCGINEGALYCWGDNTLGFLGGGTATSQKAPLRIGTASDWTEIALGYDSSCGVRSGKLYCWGRNLSGEVGTGDKQGVPEPIQIGTAANWTHITMGLPSCGLRDGELYCWGPRGLLQNDADSLTPIRVGSDSDWTAITTSTGATCGLRNGGELYCWGIDYIGQLPTDAPVNSVTEPFRIGTMTWDDIKAGYKFFCGLRNDGELYCWGDNELGKLGLGPARSIEPLRVQ